MSSGTWTNSTLAAAIQVHIASEVGHYKGKCYAWDVVNEALNDDGTYRTSVFYNTMGTSYLPVAFAAAAAADPAAKLYCEYHSCSPAFETAFHSHTMALNNFFNIYRPLSSLRYPNTNLLVNRQ